MVGSWSRLDCFISLLGDAVEETWSKGEAMWLCGTIAFQKGETTDGVILKWQHASVVQVTVKDLMYLEQGDRGVSKEKHPPQIHIFEDLGPGQGHCLQRLWKVQEVETY